MFDFSCSFESPYISPGLGMLLPTRRAMEARRNSQESTLDSRTVSRSALAFLRLASARSNLKNTISSSFLPPEFYNFCGLSMQKTKLPLLHLKKTQNIVREVVSNYRNTTDFKMQYLPIYKSDWGEIFCHCLPC